LIRLAARHPGWALGFQDETWWSRVKAPDLHAWGSAEGPLRLVEPPFPHNDEDPKALACYGLLIQDSRVDRERIWLRFVEGQPVSEVTIDFLQCSCAHLRAEGKRALLLIWDNASWHTSRKVREWLTAHNRQIKQTGDGVRIVPCFLPTQSPWLNPIEPYWLHAKRKVVEPNRLLSARELKDRICHCFRCTQEKLLSVTQYVA
jgi:transposase